MAGVGDGIKDQGGRCELSATSLPAAVEENVAGSGTDLPRSVLLFSSLQNSLGLLRVAAFKLQDGVQSGFRWPCLQALSSTRERRGEESSALWLCAPSPQPSENSP